MSEHAAERDAGMTRRRYLLTQACMAGADIFLALETVSSTAIEHPEWDMDERRTWDEWKRILPPTETTEPRP